MADVVSSPAKTAPRDSLDLQALARTASDLDGSGADAEIANPSRTDRRGPLRPAALIPSRSRLSGTLLARLFCNLDALLLVAVTVAILSHGQWLGLLERPVAAVLPFLVGAAILFWSLQAVGAYGFQPRETLAVHLFKIGAATGPAIATAVASAHVVAHRMTMMAVFWAAVLLAALWVLHALAWASVRRWRQGGRLTPNVVVVGATPNASRLIEAALATREVAVLGVFDDRLDRAPPALHGVPLLGDTQALLDHRILPYVDRIVITVTAAGEARVRELVNRLRVLPNVITLFMDTEGQDTRAATLSRLAGMPLSQLSGGAYDEQRALAKRTQDLLVGGLALAVAAPIMAVVALCVWLDSPGPVLFRQKRHGFNNETITVWKFRSMRQDVADATASRQISAGDERVTRIGRLIRATSLDELPQLVNVLKGEMSLVGPRPHAIGMRTGGEESARLVAEYAWRHRMKPGITGWAQIKGSRGPVSTAEEVRRRVALDIDYIERQSFWFDLYILIRTLPCLLGDAKTVR